ncbi:MAG: molybdopterin dinucleotide-binding protein [Gallionellales bacterium CG_4_10_14_3_um_filter_54_96]|nr:molybdopterin-dependent oxidoreductase [Gallionella sp.]PIV91129.1 MAG: molybdopterin dinucleotide-binding protein [Gallionellales bacterium CG17_big_fil_post_rev_8_21_14_2_50_54_146]PIX05527.1 MAG: molybdopterin dinucleotide-binding protein [Gallionellales bacterium CG_4_8_14_3_um_filter_54_18]PIY05114.1 MAG: molybdopterin dinucleotide-binding protein [Gallionellales bacterium CG_4_10_14_3_um_filter_54_96]PJC03695.1 MAG: molybdopterin dinucleotide-binding protein [Gallionellales bacterium C
MIDSSSIKQLAGHPFDRRDFLKVLGWSGAAVALSGCGNTSIENGKETVVSYVEAADYVIPGVAVYYNSTCAQCDAGCNINGRVREGRVLKLEGNAASAINRGKMCGLGQAGVQHHYNPDRVREPLLRKGDKGETISWDKAYALIAEKLNGVSGEQVAFLSGAVSGHLKVLLGNYLESLGSKNLYVYEAVAPAVQRAANKKAYGTEMPRFNINKAKVVLSFGADFLGSWVSPVHFSQQYAQFRKGVDGQRGVLVQVESKMTLTGANADRWLVVRPGTEGILALGIINALGASGVTLSGDVAAAVQGYDKARVSNDTGVSVEHLDKLVALLKERTPSLVLAGSAAEGYAHGSQNAAAINLLNQVLGNVGKTIEASASVPFPQMIPAKGNTAALKTLNDDLAAGKYKVLFTYATNPVFTAPGSMKFKANLDKAGFKVAFAHYLDETALEADLVLPLDSALEDWGTQVPEYMAEGAQINIQQPLMEKLHANTQGMGDILLTLVKQREADKYKDFADYYGYLRGSLLTIKGALGSGGTDDDTFWDETLTSGIIKLAGSAEQLSGNASAAGLQLPAAAAADAQYSFHLIPSVTAYLRDGRHTNQPWLQESPDPLTTIVWDSWVEIHPKKAAELGIVEGDVLEVSSRTGSIRAQAYLFPGIHPDAISIPLGRGHEALGRYAKGYGVNPFQILDAVFDQETGELALHETRVKISKVGQRIIVVKDEGAAGGKPEQRRIALSKSTDQVKLSEEV